MERSTRLSILEHALSDVVERLAEMPPTRDTDAMRELAARYEKELERWRESPPDETSRSTLLKSVLDLDVQVIRAGTRRRTVDNDNDDAEYPREL
jgi:hypothetical protein